MTVRSWWRDSCPTSTTRNANPACALAVVAQRVGDDSNVGLGVVEGQRPVSAHAELRAAEHLGEALGHQLNSAGVLAFLARPGAQVSVEQLELGVRLEDAGFDRAFELGPAQTVAAGLGAVRALPRGAAQEHVFGIGTGCFRADCWFRSYSGQETWPSWCFRIRTRQSSSGTRRVRMRTSPSGETSLLLW